MRAGRVRECYSRLYNNILNKYDWAESASSFNAIYNDTAIFGIYGTSQQ